VTADPDLRASDQDRERCATQLADHLLAGRLTLVEFDDRTGRAYAATTLRDLHTLVDDLPLAVQDIAGGNVRQAVPGMVPGAAPSVGAASHDVGRAWASWVVVNLVCLLIWGATSAAQGQLLEFWPVWVLGPWGAVLLASTARSRLSNDTGRVPRP